MYEEVTEINWDDPEETFRNIDGIQHVYIYEEGDLSLYVALGDYEHGVNTYLSDMEDVYLFGKFIADNCPPGFAGTVIEADIDVEDCFDLDPDTVGMLIADIAVGYTDQDIDRFADYMYEGYFSRL